MIPVRLTGVVDAQMTQGTVRSFAAKTSHGQEAEAVEILDQMN